ncbi:hypothetical protein KSP40_PGU001550 [Platanthera guangdongensis]|uniref:DUF632 domain-containing protein n=1 Tax=Platanthera guangdongensis TaxID=2320717 RepID=A0ABR2LRP2_9ASPA
MRETKRSHGVRFVAILGGSAAEKKSHRFFISWLFFASFNSLTSAFMVFSKSGIACSRGRWTSLLPERYPWFLLNSRISAVAISKAADGGKSKNEDERAVADNKSQSEDGAKRAVVGVLRLASHRLIRMWKAMLECHQSQIMTISSAYQAKNSMPPSGSTDFSKQAAMNLQDEVLGENPNLHHCLHTKNMLV